MKDIKFLLIITILVISSISVFAIPELNIQPQGGWERTNYVFENDYNGDMIPDVISTFTWLNDTTVEIYADDTVERKQTYKWASAICADNLPITKEEYNPATDIWTNTGELTYEYLAFFGLPDDWCEGGMGHILFGAGDGDKTYRVHLPEGMTNITFKTGQGTEEAYFEYNGYEYILQSTSPYVLENGEYVYQDGEKYLLNLTGICDQNNEDLLGNCTFEHYTINDTYYLEIGAWDNPNVSFTLAQVERAVLDTNIKHINAHSDCVGNKCEWNVHPINTLFNDTWYKCSDIYDYEVNSDNITFDMGSNVVTLEYNYNINSVNPFFTINLDQCNFKFTQNVIDDSLDITQLNITIPENFTYSGGVLYNNQTNFFLELNEAMLRQNISVVRVNNTLVLTGDNITELDPTIGPSTGGLATDKGGGDASWITKDYILVNDNNRASTGTMEEDQYSNWLYVTNFDFQLKYATIDGIEVNVSTEADNSDDVVFDTLSLIQNDSTTGNNKATGSLFPYALTYSSYGGASDLWGLTPTVNDINDNTFGIGMQLQCWERSDCASGNSDVGVAMLKIYYTLQNLTENVSACGDITEPGYYQLVNDITYTAGDCFTISSDDVILNGNGYSITGLSNWGAGTGIAVDDSNRDNITFDNIEMYGFIYGIDLGDGSTNTKVINSYLAPWNVGAAVNVAPYAENILIDNNTITNADAGLNLRIGNVNVNITNNEIYGTTKAIYGGAWTQSASDYLVHHNKFYDNDYGIRWEHVTNDFGTFYDNIFNNTDNFYTVAGADNYFNVTSTSGTNIIGGTNIGGNYWANSAGTGYSQTCADSNSDGFCDTPYNLTGDSSCSGCSGYNIDELPLTLSEGDTVVPFFSDIDDNNGTLTDNGTFWTSALVGNDNGSVWVNLQGPLLDTNITASYLGLFEWNASYSITQSGTYNYTWWALGNGTTNRINNSATFYYTVNQSSDDIYPYFENYTETPVDPEIYTYGQSYNFTVDVDNTNGTIGLEFNNFNYSASNSGNTYSTSTGELSANTYNYKWWGYGDGFANNYNETDTFTYTVNKRSPISGMSINGDIEITYPLLSDFSGQEDNLGDGGCSYVLAPSNQIFSAGIYEFNYSTTGCQNYTAGSILKNLTVLQNGSYELGLTATTPITYGTTTDFVGSGCPDELTCTLNISNAVYDSGNITASYYTSGNENYSAYTANFTVEILKADPVDNMNIGGTTPITYPTETDISVSETNTGDTGCVYTQDPLNGVFSAGIKEFNYSTQGCNNYLPGIKYFNITINQNSTYELGLTATTPITYGTTTDFVGSGCPDELTCTLNISNDIFSVGNTTASYSTVGNENYSADLAIFIVEILQNSSLIDLNLNGGDSNIFIESLTNVSITCETIVSDDTGIDLYINSSLIETDTSLIDIVYQFNDTGVYNVSCIYNESHNYTSSSDSLSVTVGDTIVPKFENIIDNEGVFNESGIVYINYTISNASSYGLMFNGTSRSCNGTLLDGQADVSCSFYISSPGTFSYYAYGNGNGVQTNYNQSETLFYVILGNDTTTGNLAVTVDYGVLNKISEFFSKLVTLYVPLQLWNTDSPGTCNSDRLGSKYFDISMDAECICLSSNIWTLHNGSVCT